MKKVCFLMIFCLILSSFSWVFASNISSNDNKIVTFVNESGQRVTIRDKTYKEYIKDLAENKNISIEEAIMLDKITGNKTLLNGIVQYTEIEVEDSLEDNDDFSAVLITQLKVRSDHSWAQIEAVMYQDIQKRSGGGYSTQIISEAYATDPSKDSSEFPVSEIYMSGTCQFQITVGSSIGMGLDVPGFSFEYSAGGNYYYYSDPLYLESYYDVY